MNERVGAAAVVKPFPEWWDNLPPSVQKNDWQQQHLCYWGYRHHIGTGLLLEHGPSSRRYSSLHWLSVLLAGDWGWRLREPFNLPYLESPLVIEQQRHTCSFLLDTKQLCIGIEGDKRVYQLAKETLDHDIDLLASVHYADLKPLVNSYIQQWVQVKWSVAVHGRDLYLLKLTLGPPKIWKHLTGVEEVVITSWPYQGHQVPYLVPDGLPPLWSDTDHWPYAPGVCSVTGKSWWILHSRYIEYSLWDNSWEFHSRIPARIGILLFNMNYQTF